MELTGYRCSNWLYRRGLTIPSRAIDVLMRLLLGAHIPGSCEIGRGSKLAYGGSGVVIHPRAVIGRNCLISPGVVIGGRSDHKDVPRIGNDVKLFPGCKVLGPITVADGVSIGANAVVLSDVPRGVVAVAPQARYLNPLESGQST